MDQTLLAGATFLIAYGLIVSEKIDRTIVALLGGLAMILFRIVSQETAFEHVDWNVIFLLAGMMIIAYILSETGVFQWLAIKAVQLGNRDPMRILILLALVTALTSAALDNVTVVVLIAPVTIFVANNLGISPIPFLVAEVLASNIGGAATLIGDPPNILVGSAANIDFVTFFINMAPPVFISMLLFIPLSAFVFKKHLTVKKGQRPKVSSLENLITDPVLLRKSLVVVGGVLVGFVLHGALHLEPATIALLGATILMMWSKTDPHKALQQVEWNTLFFFVGLFIMVEALVEVGLISAMAAQVLSVVGENIPLASMVILWVSAIASGIVDNIPYTATMIPLIQSMADSSPVIAKNVNALWFSLTMGADFGGNFTLIGASANVVVANLALRSGYKISFVEFFKYAFLITMMTLIVSTIYIWIRFLI